MILNFADLNFTQCLGLLTRLSAEYEEEFARFALCDHWNRGNGWIGPLPEAQGNNGPFLLSEIERFFVFNDVIGEIVWRAAAALKARPLRFGAALVRILDEDETATPEEQTTIAAMDQMAFDWSMDATRCCYLDRNGRLQTVDLRGLVGHLVTMLAATGRATIRCFTPPSYLQEEIPEEVAQYWLTDEMGSVIGALDADGNEVKPISVLPQVPLPDALARVHFEMPDNKMAGVYTPRSTMSPIGICKWLDDEGRENVETSWVDENGLTHLRVMQGDIQSEATLNLNGELMHLQLCCAPLIKASLLSQQKDINRRLTMSGKSSDLAGFPERVLMEAELSGQDIVDPKTNRTRFVPDPLVFGPSTFNNFKGEVIESANGEFLGVRKPEYHRLDPIDTTMFDSSVEAARARMLGEAHQAHALIAKDATASGEARKQARDEFTLSLSDLKNEAVRGLLWMLDVAWALALDTSSEKAATYEGFRWTADVPIHSGPRSVEEATADLAKIKAKTLSPETAMARDGIDDIDGEQARVKSARTSEGALWAGSTDERAILANALQISHVADEVIWKEVWGLTDAQIEICRANPPAPTATSPLLSPVKDEAGKQPL